MITEAELIEARNACFAVLHGVTEVFYRLIPVKGRCIKTGNWESCCDLMAELYEEMLAITGRCEASLPKVLDWIKRTNSLKNRQVVSAGDIHASTYHELGWKLGLRVERILALAEQSFESCNWEQPEELGWIADYADGAQKLIPYIDHEATDSLVRFDQDSGKVGASQEKQTKPEDPLQDYRSGPGGPLLTARECEDRFSLSNSTLSRASKSDPTIRIKNPSGGSGFIYRYDAVSRLANKKSDEE